MNDKMIEEMAKDLEMVEKEAYSKIAKETQLYVKENHRYNSKEDYFLAHTKTIYELVAEALIKLGYRKIKAWQKETAKEFVERLKESLDISVIGYSSNEVISNVEDTIDNVAKQFGVEVEE